MVGTKTDNIMKNQISKRTLGAQPKVNNPSDAMFIADIAHQATKEAIADALFQARVAEHEAIADALCMAKIMAEAKEDTIADVLSQAELAYKVEMDAVAYALHSYK